MTNALQWMPNCEVDKIFQLCQLKYPYGRHPWKEEVDIKGKAGRRSRKEEEEVHEGEGGEKEFARLRRRRRRRRVTEKESML